MISFANPAIRSSPVAVPFESVAMPTQGSSILALCRSMLLTTILLSRFAIPISSDKQIPLSLVTGIIHFLCIAGLSGLTFSLRRLLAFLLVLGIIVLETLMVHSHFSVLSIIYVFAVYAPLSLGTGLDPSTTMSKLWDTFISMATGLGILGLIQVVVQIVHPGLFFDPIGLLPERFLLSNYNTTYPVLRGVIDLLKPNGMFTVEPSFFSQITALGLLGELAFFRRTRQIAVLMAALIASFSGTGLLIVGISLLFLAKPRIILGTLACAAVSVILISATGFGEAFSSRLTELSNPGTSGHERFVAPFAALSDPWKDSSSVALFGYGAGQVTAIDNGLDANYSAIPKVGLEYGIVGLGAFGLLWYSLFRRLCLPKTLVVALLVYYFLASGAFLQPFTVFSLWALTLGFSNRPVTDPADELSATRPYAL